MTQAARHSPVPTALPRTLRAFIARHTWLVVVGAAIIFILAMVAANLYSSALVWDFRTAAGGRATGLGIHSISLQSLNQYDTGYYLAIAQHGYQTVTVAAFLPLYPLTVWLVAAVFHLSYLWSGLVVSWVALCGAAVMLYKWAQLELERRQVTQVSPWLVLGLMAIFPTSLYLVLPYTESLFILLTVSTLYLYRRGYYWIAALVAALASLTRYQGLVLTVFFLADYCLERRDRNWRKLLAVGGAGLGIATYMAFLTVHYGSALTFLTAEQQWHRLAGNVLVSLFKSFTPIYVWYLSVLAVALWATARYVGKAYALYSLAFILLPLSSGKLDSLNRYMLGLAPLFLGLVLWARAQNRLPLAVLYVCSSVFLLAWSILLFANGYWVG